MLTTFFYIFYVLFAIVLINLFIGIVTDAFPKARRHSQEAWEKLITRMLEVSTSACTLVGHGIDRDGVLDHTRNTRNFNKLCRGWDGASGGRCHFAGAETDSAWWKRLSKPGAMFVTVAAVALVRGLAKLTARLQRERADTSTLAAVAAVTLTMQPNNANNASERLKSSPGEVPPSASLQHRHSGRTPGSIDRQTSQRSEGTLPRQQSLGMDASARALGSRHFPDAPAAVGFPDAVDGGELPPYRPVLESQSSRWSRTDAASGRWSVRHDVEYAASLAAPAPTTPHTVIVGACAVLAGVAAVVRGHVQQMWLMEMPCTGWMPTSVPRIRYACWLALYACLANNTAHTSTLQALTALTAQLATMQSALQDVSRRLRSDQ